MLKKLIKYDLKATARSFAPIYVIVMALAILSAIFERVCNTFHSSSGLNVLNVLSGITLVLYFLALFVVNILTLVICMRFFYDNFFKDEGYLMHTLPVTPAKLIWSKVIMSALWGIATVAISLLSAFIVMTVGRGQFSYNWFNFHFGISHWEPMDVGVLLSGILTIVIGIIFIELCICASLCVGSLVPKHHAAVCIGMIIAFCIVHVVLAIFVVAFMQSAPNSNWLIQTFRAIDSRNDGYKQITICGLLAASVYMAAFSALYFVIAQSIMKNHLNLE